MFTIDCPNHGCSVLLPHSRIVLLDNQDDRIVLRWRCWCGHLGESITGRRPTGRAA